DLTEVLDPWRIVQSRQAEGGAAPEALARMTAALRAELDRLDADAAARTAAFDDAEARLLATARAVVSE
ncbi:MAG TPA: argininosuccinate lyase, partial [Pseudonocardia sp.]